MAERFTNNFNEYKAELVSKLESPPEIQGHEFVLFYSVVTAFLNYVHCFFIYSNRNSGNLLAVKRTFDPRTITSNYGIFFPDKIKFSQFVFEVDAELSLKIKTLLEQKPEASNPLTHIILDGADFHLKTKDGVDQTWRHGEQLNQSALELTKLIDDFWG